VITALVDITLVYPGTALDQMWKINPAASRELTPYGKSAGFLCFGVSPLLAISGGGILYSRRWGYYGSLFLIGANGLRDAANILRGEYVRGLPGIFFAGLFFLYLLSPRVKDYFHEPPSTKT
jgi:hypothetical protein